MASFKKTYIAPFDRNSLPLSGDALYWRQFTPPILLKEINSIDYIDVSPVEPHFVSVTCSARVQLYHPITRIVHKNYNRFKEAAHGGVFRRDGRLLLAGSDEGAVRLFDVSSKHLLRVFKGSQQRAVHRCDFLPVDHEIVSFSDDKTVSLWDMSNEALLHKFEGHTDYVRCGQTVPAAPNLIVSGSYDHTVKVWDKRGKAEVIGVDHGAPVESVLVSPNGSLLFTSGFTDIKVWDLLAGGRLLSKISQHHKTITCLILASGGKRLLSGSLDRHVKVYDMSTFEVIRTFDYSSPILSLGISPNDQFMVVGMSDGIIAISRKEEPQQDKEEEDATNTQIVQQRRKKSKSYSTFVETDFGVKEELTPKDKKYDAYLRRFRYSKALDDVLNDYFYLRNPAVTVAVCQELIRRDGLRSALAGRSGKSLSRVLRFLIKHIGKPRFSRILLEVADTLVDLYVGKVGDDPTIDQLFLKLHDEVAKETKYVMELMEVKGYLNMLMVSSEERASYPAASPTAPPLQKLVPSEEAQQTFVVSIKDK